MILSIVGTLFVVIKSTLRLFYYFRKMKGRGRLLANMVLEHYKNFSSNEPFQYLELQPVSIEEALAITIQQSKALAISTDQSNQDKHIESKIFNTKLVGDNWKRLIIFK